MIHPTGAKVSNRLEELKTMKKALALVALLASSLAVAQNPIKVISSNGVLTFKNVSTKTVILVAGHTVFSTPGAIENGKTLLKQYDGNLAHEFLFKEKGFPAGESFDLDTKDGSVPNNMSSYTATITFVQFEDGSTWGDRNDWAAQEALQRRNNSLRELQQGVSARVNAKDRWAAALSRRGIWSF
jgi:hypothetical protein